MITTSCPSFVASTSSVPLATIFAKVAILLIIAFCLSCAVSISSLLLPVTILMIIILQLFSMVSTFSTSIP